LGTRSRPTGSGRPFIAYHRGKKSKGRAQSTSGITNAKKYPLSKTGENHSSRRKGSVETPQSKAKAFIGVEIIDPLRL
jgi:hypothetical protein